MSIRILLVLLALGVGMAPTRLRAQADADSLGEYFPLAVGNVWQYHYRYATIASYGAPYTIAALGDTVMPNGKRYIRFNVCPLLRPRGHTDPDARYSSNFARYDSGDGTVYMYDTTGTATTGEFVIYPLRAWLEPSTLRGERGKWSAFGDSLDALIFPSVGSDEYVFARGIGLVHAGLGDQNDIAYEYHELIYARINGREYGQLLSAPALEAGAGVTLGEGAPNPFAASTTIPFTLGRRDHVRLDVVNAIGEEVATLIDGELEAGSHRAALDGAGLPGGLYIVRMRVGGATFTRSVVLAR